MMEVISKLRLEAPMPAKDLHHDSFKAALIKDGWIITDDPFIIAYEDLMLFADLAAERTLAVERNDERAVVEIKSFVSDSDMREFETALGQYVVYRVLLSQTEPERKVYLAVSNDVFEEFFTRPAIQLVIDECQIALIVVDLDSEEVVQWNRPQNTKS